MRQPDYDLSLYGICKTLLEFALNPVYTFTKCSVSYTTTINFLPTHYVFWHAYLIFIYRSVIIFYDDSERRNLTMIVLGFSWIVFIVVLAMYMPQVQNRTNMKISRIMYHTSIASLLAFYYQSTSYFTNLYIELPCDHRPFSRLRFNVVWIGIVHVITAVLVATVTTHIPECFLLLLLSFFLCVDTISVFTTKQYLIRMNRKHKWQYEESSGIVCHVYRRQKSDENDVELMPGHQYEDAMELDPEWYRSQFSDYCFEDDIFYQ